MGVTGVGSMWRGCPIRNGDFLGDMLTLAYECGTGIDLHDNLILVMISGEIGRGVKRRSLIPIDAKDGLVLQLLKKVRGSRRNSELRSQRSEWAGGRFAPIFFIWKE